MLENLYRGFYGAFIEKDRYLLYLKGLSVTLEVTVLAILIGTALGIVLALMRRSSHNLLKVPARIYIDVIRGTPLMVQLLILYMVVFTAPNTSKIFVSVMAFGLNSGAYIAEIIRAGIGAVDKGQFEAGSSLGLNKTQTMVYIIMPQAIKNVLPTYANEFIVLIKETSIVGYIGLEDLTKMSSIVTSRTYEAFFPLIIIALMYLALTTILSYLFGRMERRLRTSDRH